MRELWNRHQDFIVRAVIITIAFAIFLQITFD